MISPRRLPAALLTAVTAMALSGCVVEVVGGRDPLIASPVSPDSPYDHSGEASDVASGDGYSLLMTVPETGEPVTYSSCEPVRYVTNLEGAPRGVERLVEEAVEEVADATGLDFADEGSTDEVASPGRAARQERYGGGWAPVLIAWTDPTAVPSLEGPAAGLGGSTAVSSSSGATAYVTGIVYLDGPDLEQVLDRPGGRAQVRAVIKHELGHLVGLGHVDDRSQLMHGSITPGITEFQSGDRAGLEVVGNGPCTEELTTLA